MRRTPGRPWAALAALAAVGIYTVCCKPAWSPESDRVAYIGSDGAEQNARWTVSVYEPSTGANRAVESVTVRKEEDLVPIEVFWTKRDEVAFVSAPSEGGKDGVLQLSTCDLTTGEVTRGKRIALPKVELGVGGGPMHLDERGRRLWLTTDEGVYRVALDAGEARKLERAQILLVRGDALYYASVAAPAAEPGLEFGRIRTFPSLKERPLFHVAPTKGETLTPLTGMPERRTLFGCVSAVEGVTRLRIFDEKGKETSTVALPPDAKTGDGAVFGTQWSPDGSVLWMGLEGNDSGVSYRGVAEIRVPEGSVRIIKLNNNGERGDLQPLQLSLSPDGSKLAVSTIADGNAGLCVVDLERNDRAVAFVPPPAASPGAGGG